MEHLTFTYIEKLLKQDDKNKEKNPTRDLLNKPIVRVF